MLDCKIILLIIKYTTWTLHLKKRGFPVFKDDVHNFVSMLSLNDSPWTHEGRCVRLTTLPPSCDVMKSGSLKLLDPSGPVQACNGTALPFTMNPKRTCSTLSTILNLRMSCVSGLDLQKLHNTEKYQSILFLTTQFIAFYFILLL